MHDDQTNSPPKKSMIEIKNFTETDFEFNEVTRLYNLVSHDDQEHVDDT